MSSPPNRDPAKRAAKRRARREAVARGSVINPRQRTISASQAAHASNGGARKKARHGERLMDRERAASSEPCDNYAECQHVRRRGADE